MAQTGPLRADCAQGRDGRSAADELELSTHAADSWPLRSYLELGALPSAVPCARLHAKQVLWEWGLDALAEAVELVVSDSLNLSVCSPGPFCCFSGRGSRGFRGWLWRLGGG
jgi:hypothetical protein